MILRSCTSVRSSISTSMDVPVLSAGMGVWASQPPLANSKKSSPGLIATFVPEISKPHVPKCRLCSGSSPRAEVDNNRPLRIISVAGDNELRGIFTYDLTSRYFHLRSYQGIGPSSTTSPPHKL